MKLVDMRLTKKEIKERSKPATVGMADEEYPWGLCLRLESEAIKKLGLTNAEPGDVSFQGVGRITTIHTTATEKQTVESMEIQVVKLAVTDKQSFASGFKEATEKE